MNNLSDKAKANANKAVKAKNGKQEIPVDVKNNSGFV